MYKRFGKFCFSDYASLWIGVIMMLACGILSFFGAIVHFIENYFSFFGLLFVAVAICMVLSVFVLHNETFKLAGDRITIKKGRSLSQKSIPSNSTLILSYTDIKVPFSYQSIILDGKISVSIVSEISLSAVLDRLHTNFVKRYTNRTIERSFGHLFVYSFVCDKALFNQLMKMNFKLLIVPATLVQTVPFVKPGVEVYIDTSC